MYHTCPSCSVPKQVTIDTFTGPQAFVMPGRGRQTMMNGSWQTQEGCVMNDQFATLILQTWKQAFPDALIFPGIGLPSQSGGVVTITHTMGDGSLMTINGLPSKSPLANNALYSAECSNGKYINLYEIMLPEIPGVNGNPSAIQRYVNSSEAQGLDIAGVHFHWTGALMKDRFAIAIHTQNVGMNPIEFVQKIIVAVHKYMGM